MILAGDIGGTKTVLAIYSGKEQVPDNPVHEAHFPSGEYPSLEAIVTEFLGQTKAAPKAACFGRGRSGKGSSLPDHQSSLGD